MKQAPAKDIDEYISGFPEPVRLLLTQMRTTVKAAVPNTEETMSYNLPTLSQEGNLIHFGAFKGHIGFYPTPSGIENFKQELAPYTCSLGAIQFPFEQPLPLDLIAEITRFRLNGNLQRAARKTAGKSVR